MSKEEPSKATADKAAALDEILRLIFECRRIWPEHAADFRKDKDEAKQWRRVIERNPGDEVAKTWARHSEEMAAMSKAECEKCRVKLSQLANLVALHLPELDGKMTHVSVYARHWHSVPIDEWNPLLNELAIIEPAAVRALENLPAIVDTPSDPNDARDAWLYEQLRSNPHDTRVVWERFEELFAGQKWHKIGTKKNHRATFVQAANRHAKKHPHLPEIPKGRGGRPKLDGKPKKKTR